MPKLSQVVVNDIKQTIKTEQYQNCTEIASYINTKYNLKTYRETISNINTGKAHFDENVSYPISKKYSRNFLGLCVVCGAKATGTYDDKEYCHKHYMQMYHHQTTWKETHRDPNEYIDHGDYIEILLKNKNFDVIASTKIDIEDKERVLAYKWYCHQYESNKRYCQGTLEEGRKKRLHHFLLDINDLQGKVVDHINGDSLDNRKCNLRVVTQKENLENMITVNKLGKGIKTHVLKSGETRYVARITHNYKTISLGTFDTLKEAQQARLLAEKEIWSKK